MGYSNLLLIFYCVTNLREHNKRLIEELKKVKESIIKITTE